MILALLVVAVTLPASMYGVYRLDRWSLAREARADARRAARARDLIATHRGADDGVVAELQAWRKSGLGSAAAR